MPRPLRHALVVLACILAVAPARAQGPTSLLDEPPAELVRAAYATQYGRAIVDGFGAILRTSADPTCARNRGLNAARLAESGGDMLRRHGMRTVATYLTTLNAATIRTTLAARGEPGAEAEIAALRNDPDVRTLIAIDRRAKLAAVVDMSSEMFSRGALEARLRLSKAVSPLISNDEAQLALNPSRQAADDFQRFIAASRSPRVARYFALATLIAEAATAAVDQEATQRITAAMLFQGFDAELAALCIGVER